MRGRRTIQPAPRPGALVVAALALAVAVAPVVPPWMTPVAHAADRKAADLQARKAFTAGEYEKALNIYVDLYGETHHPTYLRNIARCHQNMGHADKAISGFREYLRKAPNLTSEQQAEVERFIAEMEDLKKKEASAATAGSSSTASPGHHSQDTDGARGDAGVPAAGAGGTRRQNDTETARSPVPIASDPASKPSAVDVTVAGGPREAEASAPSPFYTRFWFWAAVGAAAAGIAAGVLLLRPDRGPAYGNLGHVNVPGSQ